MDRNSNIGNGCTREEGYENRSLGNLLQEMGRQSQRLLRGEITLARAEFKAEAKKAAAGAGILTAAGGLLLTGRTRVCGFSHPRSRAGRPRLGKRAHRFGRHSGRGRWVALRWP